MNYGGNNLIRQYFDVNGKNYFSAFAEYNVGLGERNEKNEFLLILLPDIMVLPTSEIYLTVLYMVDY